MTTSLGKRSSINGISDIAYSDEKAPVYTSTDQFIQGNKTFNSPIKALSNVLCSGSYYGDGSHLTNVVALDPSKLPLSGGTLTGPLTVVSLNGEIMTITSNSLSCTNANLAIDSTGSTSIGASGNISLTSTANGDINLFAFNLNSYGFALPVCFDFTEIDRNFTYSGGGQNWELVWQKDLYIPTQFFTEAPSSGYASKNWRIDFTINTWNAGGGNNSQDKATAYYIIFEDQAGNVYTPQIITPQTPYCRHNNNSTWTAGGSYSEFQPFSWSDMVDLQGISGSYSSLLPLRFKVYFAADNPKDFRFNYKLGLTRTNLIL